MRLFIIIFIFLFTACKSVKQSDYLISNPNKPLLSNLLPIVNNKNLETKITIENVVYTTETPNPEFNPKIMVNGHDALYIKTSDNRVKDLLKLYNIYINHNICDNTQDLSGKISLEIIHYKQKRNPIVTILSAWTLFTINLLGVPSRIITTEAEVRLSILNRSNISLKTYTSKSKSDSYTALYWGYGEDTRRISSINTFKKIFEDLKIQMDNDAKEINELISQ